MALPPPAYGLAAELLARTLDAADSSAGLRHRLEQIAAEVGRELPRTGDQPHHTAEKLLDEVGRLTLDRNPTDYHTEVEQAAFEPNNLVPGIGPSPDKMLLVCAHPPTGNGATHSTAP